MVRGSRALRAGNTTRVDRAISAAIDLGTLVAMSNEVSAAGARREVNMHSSRASKFLALVPIALWIVGCSSARDVEVTGEVSAAQIKGVLTLEFFEVDGDQRESVFSTTLSAPGSFAETISVAGDKVIVRAVDDVDGDGACSAGEAWAEAEAMIDENDEVEPVQLALASGPCPE